MTPDDLYDVVIRDAYWLTVKGSLIQPEPIDHAIFEVKDYTDPETPISMFSLRIMTLQTPDGYVEDDGSLGPFTLRFILSSDQTGLLSRRVKYYYGVTIVTASGVPYSPIPSSALVPLERVVISA